MLVACGGEARLNNETVEYTPEERPLGVLAGDDKEVKPGDSVTLEGRLVGTVEDESVLWTQVQGPDIQVDDAAWGEPSLTFEAPMVEGVASLTFKIEAVDADGTVIAGENGNPLVDEVEIVVFDPNAVLFFEVEDTSVATLSGVSLVTKGEEAYIPDASGEMHTADIEPGSSVDYTLNFPMTKEGEDVTAEPGFYTLYVVYAIPSDYGGKQGKVTVNGQEFTGDFKATGLWEEFRAGVVEMVEGDNSVAVGGGWNYYRIDYIYMVPSAEAPPEPEPEPEPELGDVFGAGLYEGFEPSLSGWEVQIGWSPVDGGAVTTDWATMGLNALTFERDLSAEDSPSNVVFQTYPEEGLDVSGADTLSLDLGVVDAGPNVMAKLWVKHGESQEWADAGAVAVDGGVTLSIDVSSYEMLAGYGVEITGFDPTSANAVFYLDGVKFFDADDGLVIFESFEPDTSGWHGQLDWTNTPSITTTSSWSASGNRALAYVPNLTDGPSSAVMQVYPTDGLDVSGASTLTLSVDTSNLGDGVSAKLWVKHGEAQEWADAGAVSAQGELSIDVSNYDLLAGMGVEFTGFDSSSTDGQFLIDSVKLDGALLYDFEGAGSWEFQSDWAPVPGAARISTEWSTEGAHSLVGVSPAGSSASSVVLQVYPENGITLTDDLTMLHVSVGVIDAGDLVTAKLWRKDKDGVWKDGGPVELDGLSTDLEVDISGLGSIQGLGVQFENIGDSSTESRFFLDNVRFSQ
ncbi:hypothetical protein [Marinimicrobium sp. C2-29]|uniref:hypothetical protein n=1 Tax=Marinimicrobium sp. C2-29 TaxID=3139825 RepID=UPI003139D4A1